MNWGYRVILILVVFVAGIISMVYISMKQTNEIVDSNYYEREMKYQGVIDGKQNLNALADSVTIFQDNEYVQIIFPAAAVNALDSGNIEFMKLSTSKGDRNFEMKKETGTTYKIPESTLIKGWYKVRLVWNNNGVSYYDEKNFNLK